MVDWMQTIWRKLKGQDLTEVTQSTATTVTELRTDFNNLLTALRNAGVIR